MFPCGQCGKQVRSNQRGVQCEDCLLWYHSKCLGLSTAEYSLLQRSSECWFCKGCSSSHPEAQPHQPTAAATLDADSTISEANSTCSQPAPCFSILSMNCRSILVNTDHLRTRGVRHSWKSRTPAEKSQKSLRKSEKSLGNHEKSEINSSRNQLIMNFEL